MDARLLSPDPERFRPSPPVVCGGHAMTAWPEVSIDDAVNRQETLCLTWRLEPLHLPLSSSRWPMRVFSTIVEVAARAVFDIGQKGTPRNAIAAQTIGNQALRLVLQA